MTFVNGLILALKDKVKKFRNWGILFDEIGSMAESIHITTKVTPLLQPTQKRNQFRQ